MRELLQDSPAVTAREVAILRFIADGYSNAHIARLLSCSHHTVKNVIHGLMARLQLRNRAHAAAYAVRAGLI
jgi:DNA-binding NarL/FixJ family response regulator